MYRDYVKKTRTNKIMNRTSRNNIIMHWPLALAFFMTIATFFCKISRPDITLKTIAAKTVSGEENFNTSRNTTTLNLVLGLMLFPNSCDVMTLLLFVSMHFQQTEKLENKPARVLTIVSGFELYLNKVKAIGCTIHFWAETINDSILQAEDVLLT